MPICDNNLGAAIGQSGSMKLSFRQQPVVFLLDHRITLAGALFQTRAVEHRDVAARIADDSGLLELQGTLGDPLRAARLTCWRSALGS
jgi:hypothetical protein